MTLTEDQLFRSMKSLTRVKAREYLPPLNAALAEFGITEPRQVAHFLGQLAHESGDLRYWQEIWGPTPAQIRYSSRADLGNTHPEAVRIAKANGDTTGHFFAGHGPIQTTGYANHKRVADALKIDCVNKPLLLASPQHGFRAAALFWADNKLNALALKDDIRAITKRINGGFNGLEDRILKTNKAKTALGL